MKTLKIALALTCLFSIFFAQFINAQWATAGNANGTILNATFGSLGTSGTKDVEFIVKGHQAAYLGAGTLSNAAEGAFGIGLNGSLPQNKLLVENGTIYTTVGGYSPPYNALLAILNANPNYTAACIDPAEISLYAYSNAANNSCGMNEGIFGVADAPSINGIYYNVGVAGIANGSSSNNTAGYFFANGPDASNLWNNAGINATAQGAGALSNDGGNFLAGGGLSNTGVFAQLTGTTGGATQNYGVVGDLSNFTMISSTTVPYYSFYGIAPLSSATSGTLTLGPNANDVYAGYFDGDVFCSSTYYYSDAKLKDNITSYSGALDKLNQLNVKSYTFKQKDYPSMNFPVGQQVGVLAEDLQKIFPNLVKNATQPAVMGKDKKVKYEAVNFEAVNYPALIPVLVQGLKEVDAKTAAINPLAATVAQQQAQIAQLLEQVNSQNNQINDLRNTVNDICNVGCGGLQGNTAPVTPQDVALYQSIPNPTSGVATIGYVINIPFTTASINITTLNGGTVQQFKITEGGKGSITFDGSRYASGTFNYTLYIDGKAYDTKTIVIAKN